MYKGIKKENTSLITNNKNAMKIESNLEHVLHYSENLRFSVIPLKPKTKGEVYFSWKRYQKQKPTMEEIKSWWTQNTNANIGVICGSNSGIAVMDIDKPELFKKSGINLPFTATVKTKKGHHYYYRIPKDVEVPSMKFNFGELQSGNNLLIVAPPSIHPEGIKYEWVTGVPESLDDITELPINLLKKLDSSQKKKQIGNIILPKGPISEGNRNNTIASIAGTLLQETPEKDWNSVVLPKLYKINTEQCTTPLAQNEVLGIFRSICSAELTNRKNGPKNKEKKKKSPVVRVSSIVHGDIVAECIFDKLKEKSVFVTLENGSIKEHEQFLINGIINKPLDPQGDMLKVGIVTLPSKAQNYESEEKLLDEIINFIHKYVDISIGFERITAYYVLLSWMYDKFHEVPYLRVIADYGSGKSRFLKVLSSICNKPIETGGATTTAPIFRMINQIKGTLILDEADMDKSDMGSELVKILNMGYMKNGNVLRCEGQGTYEVKAFNVFGPKVVATRELFKDQALESRFLVEYMGNKEIREDIPLTLTEEFYKGGESIRNQLLMWRLKNYKKDFDTLKQQSEWSAKLPPRLRQVTLPMLALIKSEKMKDSLKEFMIDYGKTLAMDKATSYEAIVLEAIISISKSESLTEITIKQITESTNEKLRESDGYDDILTSRRVGWYIRNRLQLKTERRNVGYVLSTVLNKKAIENLAERYGINDNTKDMDDVDVVNKF